MPEISRFFGIIITMNYSDHSPPHFHVRYGDQKALIEIRTMRLLEGSLAPRVFGMVMEWGLAHHSELRNAWNLAQENRPLPRISPLE
ncbi:MAG TPA: DUF4160 domain-containing protein [Candidatus Ozemobacteraceae bacterium]|nr:DUF4160 domain-containing protein [Candidatus Ozemobacteraceae bacterium]HQG27037.1 DUF4160 domain-containing protein [Candidatus Ozemobacteraceae bacterium]